MSMVRLAIVVLSSGLVVGCASPAERAQEPPAAGQASSTGGASAPPVEAAGAPADAAASPHGVASGPEATVTASGATLSTPTFAFDLPAAWRKEQPSSSMRLAQAVVPGQ